MEVNPGVYVARPDDGRARDSSRRSRSCARRSRSRSRGTTRCRPACGCGRPRGISFLASYTLGNAEDHVSGLNIGGEPRPVLPVTIGDEASIERALDASKRAPRSSTCAIGSS